MSLSSEPFCADLNVLLFSLNGVFFGVDVEQIESMSAYNGQEAGDCYWFHRILGIDRGEMPCGTPPVLTIRTGDSERRCVLIDALEDILSIRTEEIHPMPKIIAPFIMAKGLWGVLLRNGKPSILLVDFLYLVRERSRNSKHEERDEK